VHRVAADAYWINAYNFLMLEAIVAEYPVDSYQRIPSVMDRSHYSVGGRTVSLDYIEQRILRRNSLTRRCTSRSAGHR